MGQNKFYIIIASLYIIVISYDVANWLRYRKLSSSESKTKRLRSTVNFFVLITGLTMTFSSILFNVNILDYNSPIEYQQINNLTLSDFKGLKIPGTMLDGQKEFAFIVTSIEHKSSSNKVIIRSLFHPSRSYVYNENLIDKTLLRHELYHFHITELFARKVREELSKNKNKPTNSEILEIINRYQESETEMQRQYDNESYHSYVLKEQKNWERKIDSLLTLHDNYASTTITY